MLCRNFNCHITTRAPLSPAAPSCVCDSSDCVSAARRAPAAAREPRRAMGVASESVPCAGVWARCVRTHVDVCARVCVCRACAGVCASGGRASSTTPSSAARARESDRARFKESIYDYSKLCLNIFARISSRILMRCAQAP